MTPLPKSVLAGLALAATSLIACKGEDRSPGPSADKVSATPNAVPLDPRSFAVELPITCGPDCLIQVPDGFEPVLDTFPQRFEKRASGAGLQVTVADLRWFTTYPSELGWMAQLRNAGVARLGGMEACWLKREPGVGERSRTFAMCEGDSGDGEGATRRGYATFAGEVAVYLEVFGGEDAGPALDAVAAEVFSALPAAPDMARLSGLGEVEASTLTLAQARTKAPHLTWTRDHSSKLRTVQADSREVSYAGPLGKMRAYTSAPPTDGKRHPALLWAHSGTGVGLSRIFGGPRDQGKRATAAFVDAGVFVMAPAWRGELDNPGKFELFGGEVDDLMAARAWLAKQPHVDPDRIYVLGQGLGGSIALLAAALAKPGEFAGVVSIEPWIDLDARLQVEDFRAFQPEQKDETSAGFAVRSSIRFAHQIQVPTLHFQARDTREALNVTRIPGVNSGSAAFQSVAVRHGMGSDLTKKLGPWLASLMVEDEPFVMDPKSIFEAEVNLLAGALVHKDWAEPEGLAPTSSYAEMKEAYDSGEARAAAGEPPWIRAAMGLAIVSQRRIGTFASSVLRGAPGPTKEQAAARLEFLIASLPQLRTVCPRPLQLLRQISQDAEAAKSAGKFIGDACALDSLDLGAGLVSYAGAESFSSIGVFTPLLVAVYLNQIGGPTPQERRALQAFFVSAQTEAHEKAPTVP